MSDIPVKKNFLLGVYRTRRVFHVLSSDPLRNHRELSNLRRNIIYRWIGCSFSEYRNRGIMKVPRVKIISALCARR